MSQAQNLMLASSLMMTTVIACIKLLEGIEKEAAQARVSGTKRHFRMGETAPHLQHLHTGTLDCPMGFNIDLDADEWERLVKRAVKNEIFDRSETNVTLEGMITKYEDRQRTWHSRGAHDHPQPEPVCSEEDWTCMRLASGIRSQIERIPRDQS